MPRIAKHHSWKDSDFSPREAWSEDTYVQWGGNGVVIGKNPYTTAFFEAFPPANENAGGFIRGEGKTIAEAEKDAFSKYQKETGCDHYWGRERYRNSGQLCRHCRAFRSGFVKPIYIDGHLRKPLEKWEVSSLEMHTNPDDIMKEILGEKSLSERRKSEKWVRKLQVRKSLFGVKEYPETNTDI